MSVWRTRLGPWGGARRLQDRLEIPGGRDAPTLLVRCDGEECRPGLLRVARRFRDRSRHDQSLDVDVARGLHAPAALWVGAILNRAARVTCWLDQPVIDRFQRGSTGAEIELERRAVGRRAADPLAIGGICEQRLER